MQNKHKPIDTHSSLRICPAHLEFARELDRSHGRAIAKNYLRQVTNPDYMSPRKLGAVKHSEKTRMATIDNLDAAQRPPEGWQKAICTHIEKVGKELTDRYPGVKSKGLKRLISKTYPYGARESHPYRIWRKELKAYIKQFELDYLGQQLAESYHQIQGRQS